MTPSCQFESTRLNSIGRVGNPDDGVTEDAKKERKEDPKGEIADRGSRQGE